MMSQEQNDLITAHRPERPCGKLMRMYWQPAALVDELQGPRAIRPVKLLGEDLVLFRDEAGRYGLIDRALRASRRRPRFRPARTWRAALRLPRLAVRRGGPVPARRRPNRKDSKLCQGIRQRAYPVVEKSGMLWAYLGEGEPPAFPELDCFVAPGQPHLRVQGPYRLQLAAGARGRHRSLARLVPASLLRGRGHLPPPMAASSAAPPPAPTCR